MIATRFPAVLRFPVEVALTEAEWAEAQSNYTVLALSPFESPNSISFGGRRGRSFAAERAQASLSRYFSPNVAAELATSGESALAGARRLGVARPSAD